MQYSAPCLFIFLLPWTLSLAGRILSVPSELLLSCILCLILQDSLQLSLMSKGADNGE